MLQKLAIILQASMDDFKTLFLCFMMVVVLGGACIYFLESHTDDGMFTDIPTSVYWATVTITTVGYGDYYPTSIQGQMWATCFMFFGALTLCIPIISVITKLSALYEKDSAACAAANHNDDDDDNNINDGWSSEEMKELVGYLR